MNNPFLIALNKATDENREAVQAIVKVHATGWWHNFTDVWIVGGHNAPYWRDLIAPTLMNSTAEVLVLALPSGGGSWATSKVKTANTKWLRETYLPQEKPLFPGTDDDIPF